MSSFRGRLLSRGAREGSLDNPIVLLQSGTGRVVFRHHPTQGVVRPGEVVGERSFFDDSEASASVIAEEEVEATLLERGPLCALLQTDAELAARFYRSLGAVVATRLRTSSHP